MTAKVGRIGQFFQKAVDLVRGKGKLRSGQSVSLPAADTQTVRKSSDTAGQIKGGAEGEAKAGVIEMLRARLAKGFGRTKEQGKTSDVAFSILSPKEKREVLAKNLKTAGMSEDQIALVIDWHKKNWHKIVTPQGAPRPPSVFGQLFRGRVTPLSGLKHYTDPTTGKEILEIAAGRGGGGSFKSAKFTLDISLSNMNVVGGIRFTRTHTYDRGGEEEIKNQTDAFNKDIQKELRWRDEMKHSNSGRLPNEISEIVKVTYTSRKTGEKKARYVGQLCDGEVADEMYTTSDGVRARKPSFDQQKVLRCYADVFTALDFLHERKIVHRDLKPGNVLVKGGKGVLNDFGSAGLAGSPEVIGTLGYTAPEILMLQGCDVSSDIFSMGMMLYETLDYAGFAALQESQWGLQQVAGQVAEVDSKDPKAKEELAKELNTYMGKLEEAREKMAASENPLLKFAGRLMNFDPTQRPTAKAAGEEYRKILAEGSGVEA